MKYCKRCGICHADKCPDAEDKMKEVTMIYADINYIDCPHCGKQQDGWVGDPRGGTPEECGKCGKEFIVSTHADVNLC